MNPLGADSRANSHVKKACTQQPTMTHWIQRSVPDQLLKSRASLSMNRSAGWLKSSTLGTHAPSSAN